MGVLDPRFRYSAEDHARQYVDAGYALWRPFLTPDACAIMCRHVDRILAATAEDVSREWIMNVHLLGERWLFDLASEPALLDAVQHICGPEITLIQTHLFCKPRGCPPTPWHQDGRNDDAPMATVWITLDDVRDLGSGALQVLPGLHKHGLLPSEASDHFQFDKVLTPAFVASQTPVAYNLRAGEAAVHHPLLPHASAPNSALAVRRVLVLRYLATAALGDSPLYSWPPSEREPVLFAPGATADANIADDDDEETDDGEFYQDHRDADAFFEGRSIVVRSSRFDFQSI
ncbi:hypothetical protein SDRG_03369 [Saprolegnia diclina VS20]|uniref:Phytanoyl-CoA dioxygenase n=1 Tax=Saprolegnia diclina (strain VS20) TaxID=1156394 RepID=T0S2G5_SAPDV|nr:hypothetical protein SDRG_03369 [Saprolegnia diclina VS20]EQC39163.1 hypothetical protein SDRG_03369 [Saprolegnia diclina VS20]|eukprot:XP_008607224.1 hypothetical protein SDRG_03369 [Saprolegnia diclina VS20]